MKKKAEKIIKFPWLQGYHKAQEIADLVPDTRIVTVADREGD